MVKNFVVIGDAIIDEYLHLSVDRISPEAPVLVGKPLHTELRPGGCLNVALNLSRLGNNVIVITQFGDDDPGHYWQKICAAEGIRNINFAPETYNTILKTRLVSNNHQLMRLDKEQNSQPTLSTNDINLCLQHISSADMVVVSDYAKGMVSEHIMSLVRKYSKCFVVDPKNKDWELYRGAKTITPNLKELLTIEQIPDAYSENDVFSLLKYYDLESVLVTMSEDGVKLYKNDLSTIHFEAISQNIIDVTGAGDVVISVLSHLLAQDTELHIAVDLANQMASKSVSTFGTYVTSLHDLDTVISSKKKIVFTNGCFDLIHAGHVDYLRKAKAMGDVLIVGLNSDASVQKLKGKNRPINSQSDRKFVLEALKFVDQVVIFSETTPLSLIKTLRPDILVKGGDYPVKEIIGREFVESLGGKVCTIDVVYDTSTTNILATFTND